MKRYRLKLTVLLLSAFIKVFGLNKTWKIVSFVTPKRKAAQHPDVIVADAEKTIKSLASRDELFGDCLPHSLILWAILARNGVEGSVRLGVSKLHGFHAHAWVEHNGHALLEGDEVYHRYHLIDGFKLDRELAK